MRHFIRRLTVPSEAERARLTYSANGQALDDWVGLERTPCPYGGSRAWFKCPRCGVRREITAIGVFVALAFSSWTYDTLLMIKAIVIAFGISVVLRAILHRKPAAS